ncbi:hypothetical protein AB0M46_06710 [Dactylosporangium sp. NPDC051485]
MEIANCPATKISPTATGDIEVRCTKPTGHVETGDPQHEAKLGVFPVRWR